MIPDSQKIIREIKHGLWAISKIGNPVSEIGIDVYDIPTGESFSYKPNKVGWAASIIKVPIMVAVAKSISEGNLSLETMLETNHALALETFDYTTNLPDNYPINVGSLLGHMIVESDNEATNILADYISIPYINDTMKQMGMKNSMLGHLLCPGVPRYTSEKNPDGSNITTPRDMNRSLRHIYDPSFSKLNPQTRRICKQFMAKTSTGYIPKRHFPNRTVYGKLGFISDEEAGADMHEVAVVGGRTLISIMMNKIKYSEDPERRSVPSSEVYDALTAGISAIFGYSKIEEE